MNGVSEYHLDGIDADEGSHRTLFTRERTQPRNSRSVSPKSLGLDGVFIFRNYTERPKLSHRLDSVNALADAQNVLEDLEDLEDLIGREDDCPIPKPPSPLDLTRTTNRQHRPLPTSRTGVVAQPPCPEQAAISKKARPQSPLARVLSPPLASLTSILQRAASPRRTSSQEWARASTGDPYPDGISSITLVPKDSAFQLPSLSIPEGKALEDSSPTALTEVSPPRPHPDRSPSFQACIDAVLHRSIPNTPRGPRPSTLTTCEIETVPLIPKVTSSRSSSSSSSSSTTTLTPSRTKSSSTKFKANTLNPHISSTSLSRALNLTHEIRNSVSLFPWTSSTANTTASRTEPKDQEVAHLEFRTKILAECGINCRTNSLMKLTCPFCERRESRMFSPPSSSSQSSSMIPQASSRKLSQPPSGIAGGRTANQTASMQNAGTGTTNCETRSLREKFHISVYMTCGLASALLTYALVVYVVWKDLVDERGWVLLACIPLLPIQYLCFMAFFDTGPGREMLWAEEEEGEREAHGERRALLRGGRRWSRRRSGRSRRLTSGDESAREGNHAGVVRGATVGIGGLGVEWYYAGDFV